MSDSPDALPKPKDNRKYPRLFGLSKKKTYSVVMYLPVALLGLCFILLFFTLMNWYKVSHELLVDITEISLAACLPMWYLKWVGGFCKGNLFAIYALALLSTINIFHYFFKFEYYILYGLITTFSGLILSGVFSKPKK